MNFDNLINPSNDPMLPDLVPEGYNYNELFPIDDLIAPMPHSEIDNLVRKLELLIIDTNSNGLRIEVERAKRRRLQTIVKQTERTLSLANAEITALRNEIAQLREQQNLINSQLDSDHARTSTLAFRSLSRVSQILSTMALRNAPTYEPNSEIEVFLHELDLTIRQFGVFYQTSYI